MNYNLDTIRRAIQSLESSVYVFERGYTKSLPHINSKRIDVLCGGIKTLAEEIEHLDPEQVEERVEKLEKLIGVATPKNPELGDTSIVQNINDLYNSIFNNTTMTTTEGDVNPWSTTITFNANDIFTKEGETNPITGEVITDEQVEKYKASIQNIKDCIQIFYDILVWLQNNQSINTVHAINVFGDEDVD